MRGSAALKMSKAICGEQEASEVRDKARIE
jgi:hypothetical protein